MDIEKLRVFCLVKEHNNYVDVANLTGISRSNIGKMILSLEKDLDTKLTNIKGKRIFATEEGNLLYDSAKKAVHNFDTFFNTYKLELSKNVNHIKINTTQSYASTWFPSILEAFNDQFPHYTYEILGNDKMPNLFEENIDISIRPYIPEQEDLVQKKITRFEMSLWASEKYIKKHGTPRTTEELSTHKIIAFNHTTQDQFDFFNWYLKFLPESFRPFVKLNSGMGIMKMVEKGLGIGPVSGAGVALSSTKLINVLPELKAPFVDIYFIYQKKMAEYQKIKDFKKILMSN